MAGVCLESQHRKGQEGKSWILGQPGLHSEEKKENLRTEIKTLTN